MQLHQARAVVKVGKECADLCDARLFLQRPRTLREGPPDVLEAAIVPLRLLAVRHSGCEGAAAAAPARASGPCSEGHRPPLPVAALRFIAAGRVELDLALLCDLRRWGGDALDDGGDRCNFYLDCFV